MPRVSVEEPCAGQVLDDADGAAQCRLRNVQRRCGGAEVRGLRDLGEGLQLLQRDVDSQGTSSEIDPLKLSQI